MVKTIGRQVLEFDQVDSESNGWGEPPLWEAPRAPLLSVH